MSFDQIGVPNEPSVEHLQIRHLFNCVFHQFTSLFQNFPSSENGCVVLHNLLHLSSDFSDSGITISVSDFVQVGNTGFSGIPAKLRNAFSRFVFLGNCQSASSSENNKIQQGVGSESVSTMN